MLVLISREKALIEELCCFLEILLITYSFYCIDVRKKCLVPRQRIDDDFLIDNKTEKGLPTKYMNRSEIRSPKTT